ncbi:uncharacterized protein LOC144159615 isoform X3 [Haemaphysalis longicornis]
MADAEIKPSIQFRGTGLQPPPKFDFGNPSSWKEWVYQFDDYCYASGLYEAPGEVQVRTLLYAMCSQDARRVLDTLALSSEDWSSLEAVKMKFTDHFIHPVNEVYESVRFHRRTQGEGETVDEFYTALRTLVKKCNYASAEVEERLVRDRFVVGLRDSNLVDKLFRTQKLTLEEARLPARINEDAVKARAAVFQKEPNPAHVIAEAKVQKRFQKPRHGSDSQGSSGKRVTKSNTSDATTSCRYCGRPTHPRADCPAGQAKCKGCNRIGYFEAVCEKKSKKNMGALTLHSVAALTRAKFVKVAVNGRNANFKVDSGAEVTVIPDSFPGIPKQLQKPEGELTGPGNYSLTVLGTFQAKLSWKGRSTVQTVYVVPSQDQPLLGFPAIQALGVLRFVDSVTDSTVTLKDSLFDGLGELQDDYVIRLQPGAKPFSLSVPRRVPIPLHKPVGEELSKLESQGVIRRVDRPTPWCSEDAQWQQTLCAPSIAEGCVAAMSVDAASCRDVSCSQTQASITTCAIGVQCGVTLVISRGSQTRQKFSVRGGDETQGGASKKFRASGAGPHTCSCPPRSGNTGHLSCNLGLATGNHVCRLSNGDVRARSCWRMRGAVPASSNLDGKGTLKGHFQLTARTSSLGRSCIPACLVNNVTTRPLMVKCVPLRRPTSVLFAKKCSVKNRC